MEHKERVLTEEEKLEGVRKLLLRSKGLSRSNFGVRVHFYTPSFISYRSKLAPKVRGYFPSISITGYRCALRCKHCGGKLLKTMIPVTSPSKLLKVCSRIKELGGVGCLISGGSGPDGKVPIKQYIDAISMIKKSLELTIFVHTGLVDEDTAIKMKEAGVDAALIDVIGSNETIKDVYRLNATVEDFEFSLSALKEAGVPIVPHVLVGLHYGKVKGEYKALEMISRHDPSALIIIVFFPIKGTVMEEVRPPHPLSVARLMAQARLMMPNTPISLGCARPKRKYRAEIDRLAIKAGVNAIAFPDDAAIIEARREGLEIRFSPFCCSQIYRDISAKRET